MTECMYMFMYVCTYVIINTRTSEAGAQNLQEREMIKILINYPLFKTNKFRYVKLKFKSISVHYVKWIQHYIAAKS